ncbi:MAG TPA: hypothetical protein VF691_04540, partial [Cytophagaceae bacterium]
DAFIPKKQSTPLKEGNDKVVGMANTPPKKPALSSATPTGETPKATLNPPKGSPEPKTGGSPKDSVPKRGDEGLKNGSVAEPPQKTANGSPEAKKEANNWELEAGKHDSTAAAHRTKAADLREAAVKHQANNSMELAAAAEKKATLAEVEAIKAEKEAYEIRLLVKELRGGSEGLTARQLMSREQLILQKEQTAAQLKIKSAEKDIAAKEWEAAKARVQKAEESYNAFQKNKKTWGTKEYTLSQKELQLQEKTLEESLKSANNNASNKQKAFDKALAEHTASSGALKKASIELEKLSDLERGLSEGDDIAKGIFGEAKADDHMISDGYEKIGGHDAPQGIDGVYRKRVNGKYEYVVVEAKYGTSQLKMTADGLQLSRNWCDRRILKALQAGKLSQSEIAAIELEMKANGYKRSLLRFDPEKRIVREEPPPK